MSESKLLAIETSSSTGSIALKSGDTIAVRIIATPREQTPRILAIIDELLSEAGLKLANLDGLVFGRGPGSFTGLRVAAAVVQGLSFSASVPIVSVSSLAALAQNGFNRDQSSLGSASRAATNPRALCCVDARMGEVYWASFRLVDGLAEAVSDEQISSPAAVAPPDSLPGISPEVAPPPDASPSGSFAAFGDGFSAYPDALAGVIAAATVVDPSIVPTARELLALGAAEIAARRFVPLEAALPVYLREADAWKQQ